VDLNAVRAGLVGDPVKWPWSSYRALRRRKNPSILAILK
jgi:hypothetical protein